METEFKIDTRLGKTVYPENPIAAVVAIVATIAFPLAGIVVGFVLKEQLPKTHKVCFWLGLVMMVISVVVLSFVWTFTGLAVWSSIPTQADTEAEVRRVQEFMEKQFNELEEALKTDPFKETIRNVPRTPKRN